MATTEIQLEENLGADHPKLQAFQKAVAAALRKRLQEADEVRAHHMFSRIFNCFFRENCLYDKYNSYYWHFKIYIDSEMKIYLEQFKANYKFQVKIQFS